MHKILMGLFMLSSFPAFGQIKANAYVPSPIPLAVADMSLAQPMVITQQGVYACAKGYTMYVNIPEPKVKAKDYVKKADPLAMIPVLDDHARLAVIPGYMEYIPVCFRIEVK